MERCQPLCPSWPDLTHTVIQQIFIKRLFVQGTSGEGGSSASPLRPAEAGKAVEATRAAQGPAPSW